MYINEIIKIENYRNLSKNRIKFDSNINFIIGENNIGKTNILELLNIILSQGKFNEKDFYDITKPIEIVFNIIYSDNELGFFESNFDADDENKITIRAIQNSIDERIEYYHQDVMMTPISLSSIKKLNLLYYYSQRLVNKEVDFRKSQGSGKVLNFLIEYSLSKNEIKEEDILKKESLEIVLKSLNEQINDLNLISKDDIKAYINNDSNKIIARMLELGDKDGRNINNLGEGIQYAFNIILQIMECIYDIKKSRSEDDFNERLVTDNSGKRLFPIFLVLDEPEIHQHPYRQRALIKEINNIITNSNVEFLKLINELFDIDGLVGQIFIATHSPNILLNDYKQFIRVYYDKEEIKITSGNEIDLDEKEYKHLLHNYVYLKEAMFSRYIIFVEGDTEYGAMPQFAKRMDLDLNLNGIGIVKLDGADGIRRCMNIYKKFGINAIAIIDRDKFQEYNGLDKVFFTRNKDFEEDVYAEFKLEDFLRYKKEIGKLQSMIGVLLKNNVDIEPSTFEDEYSKYDINIKMQESIMKEIKQEEIKFLQKNKDAYNSYILAKNVTNIPDSFQNVIKLVKKEVE